jgi:hypothetical protein
MQGKWCRKCADRYTANLKINKRGLKDAHELCLKNNWKLVSKVYVSSISLLKIQCTVGHMFQSPLNRLRVLKNCPKCAGWHKTIKDLKSFARRNWGGTCLSKKYMGSEVKHLWQCSNPTHTWWSKPGNIYNGGKRCPYCGGYTGQELTRQIFEELFNAKFPALFPEWLRQKNGYKLQLDGFNPELKIAFEVQGVQHYQIGHVFSKSRQKFEQQKARDRFKKRQCKKMGIVLVVIPHLKAIKDINDFARLVEAQILKRGLKFRKKFSGKFNTNYVHNIQMLNRYKKIVEDRGGRLLSKDYYGDTIKMHIDCGKGHKFWMTPSALYQNHWCRACAIKERKYSFEEVKNTLNINGYNVLNKKYNTAAQKLKLKCSHCGEEHRRSFSSFLKFKGKICSGRKNGSLKKRKFYCRNSKAFAP